jgi:hypothetical protein
MRRCRIGVYVEIPFSWKGLKRMMDAGINHFYIMKNENDPEPIPYSYEELVSLGVREDEILICCLIPCITAGVTHFFYYNGDETVDSVIDNFRTAKDKFRSMGFAEESIYVGNDYV